jgi:hypothetical protein
MGMKKRVLGRTGLEVSVIGLGGIGFIQDGKSPSYATRIIECALDLGINIIDTARGYSDSEDKIGQVVKRRGKDFYVVTKTMQRSAEGAWKDIHISLEKLGTDKIDIYLLHDIKWDRDFEEVMGPAGALMALRMAQAKGLVDFIGISSHRPEMVVRAIESGRFDVIEIPYNPIDAELFEDVIPMATEKDIGVMVMKPLVGGLLKDVRAAVCFVLSKDVATVFLGMSKVEHVRLDAEIGREITELREEQTKRLLQEAERLGEGFCRRCGYCVRVCSSKIPIPDIFRFERYKTSYYTGDWAKEQYKGLKIRADKCQECGRCEEICPYGLPVRKMLKRAHSELTKKIIKRMIVKMDGKAFEITIER